MEGGAGQESGRRGGRWQGRERGGGEIVREGEERAGC